LGAEAIGQTAPTANDRLKIETRISQMLMDYVVPVFANLARIRQSSNKGDAS
jgi:hypothetical protein